MQTLHSARLLSAGVLAVLAGVLGAFPPAGPYSCCNKRTVTPEPDRTCDGTPHRVYNQYDEVHDCDDAEGFDEIAQILDIKARQYNHLSVGNLSSGVKLVITLPNGWFKKVESEGYQLQTGESAFEVNHSGGCFSLVDASRFEDDVYYSTWRVARCSGGRKDRSLIEIFIGDL